MEVPKLQVRPARTTQENGRAVGECSKWGHLPTLSGIVQSTRSECADGDFFFRKLISLHVHGHHLYPSPELNLYDPPQRELYIHYRRAFRFFSVQPRPLALNSGSGHAGILTLRPPRPYMRADLKPTVFLTYTLSVLAWVFLTATRTL